MAETRSIAETAEELQKKIKEFTTTDRYKNIKTIFWHTLKADVQITDELGKLIATRLCESEELTNFHFGGNIRLSKEALCYIKEAVSIHEDSLQTLGLFNMFHRTNGEDKVELCEWLCIAGRAKALTELYLERISFSNASFEKLVAVCELHRTNLDTVSFKHCNFKEVDADNFKKLGTALNACTVLRRMVFVGNRVHLAGFLSFCTAFFAFDVLATNMKTETRKRLDSLFVNENIIEKTEGLVRDYIFHPIKYPNLSEAAIGDVLEYGKEEIGDQIFISEFENGWKKLTMLDLGNADLHGGEIDLFLDYLGTKTDLFALRFPRVDASTSETTSNRLVKAIDSLEELGSLCAPKLTPNGEIYLKRKMRLSKNAGIIKDNQHMLYPRFSKFLHHLKDAADSGKKKKE